MSELGSTRPFLEADVFGRSDCVGVCVCTVDRVQPCEAVESHSFARASYALGTLNRRSVFVCRRQCCCAAREFFISSLMGYAPLHCYGFLSPLISDDGDYDYDGMETGSSTSRARLKKDDYAMEMGRTKNDYAPSETSDISAGPEKWRRVRRGACVCDICVSVQCVVGMRVASVNSEQAITQQEDCLCGP